MKRSLVRKLALASIGVEVIGFVMLIVTIATGNKTTSQLADGSTLTTVTSVNVPLLLLSILLLVGGGIVYFIAWLGALIKTAQISNWGWFVLIFLLSPLALLIYSFAGPETPAVMAYMPPQQPYPPQSNAA